MKSLGRRRSLDEERFDLDVGERMRGSTRPWVVVVAATVAVICPLVTWGCAAADKPSNTGRATTRANQDGAARDAALADARESRVEPGDATISDARATASDGFVSTTIHVSVLTQHNDARRSGANLEETALTADVVSGSTFGKLFSLAVDDQVYAEPLIVGGLGIGGKVRNVLYVATVNDSLYAFDADDPNQNAPLWTRSLLGTGEVPPRNTDMTGACNGHYRDLSGNIGIVGTPVIDPISRTLYAVARSTQSGRFVQRLHAVSVVDGSERPGSPVTIAASVPGNGEGGTTITFDPLHENQRPALLLQDGVVYIGWAGHCDWGPYHGWLMGYDATTLTQKIVQNLTPNGNAGGVWQSGQGPSSDGTDVFVVTGNGTVGDNGDPRSLVNRGESFLKLHPTSTTLTIESFFTPVEHDTLEAGDLDLGTSGVMLIPGTRLGVGGSKSGVLYVVNLDAMGGLSATETNDNVVQSFTVGKTSPERISGSPVFWQGPDRSLIYVWGENDHLKAYPYLGEKLTPGSTVLDTANVVENDAIDAPQDPGAMLSLSANRSARGSGVVWTSHPLSGDANQQVQPGVLRAFDASTLTELWNSVQNPTRDDCGKFAKFSYPTVANGKVYLPSFSNQICVYGIRK